MSAGQVGFWAAGVPIPQGSKRIGRNPATKRPILLDDNDDKLKPWREVVAHAARQGARGVERFDCPVSVGLTFYLPRPASHYRRDGSLKPSAPAWPAVKPDVDKLERAVFDAITAAGVWADDSRAVVVHKSKRYAELPHQAGVSVLVSVMPGEEVAA